MLKKMETVKTTCSKSELIKGFVDGWIKQFNQIPSKESIGVLYAQNSLETGGTKYMWNWNIGNVKAVDKPGETVEYCVLNNVWEIINGKRIILSPNDPGSWFRSFPTLADGVAHHFNFLKNNRYKHAWTAVESGNPAAFAHLLKVAGYYTASEADYIKLMNSFFNSYMKSNDYENAVSNNPKVSVWTNIGNMFNKIFT